MARLGVQAEEERQRHVAQAESWAARQAARLGTTPAAGCRTRSSGLLRLQSWQGGGGERLDSRSQCRLFGAKRTFFVRGCQDRS